MTANLHRRLGLYRFDAELGMICDELEVNAMSEVGDDYRALRELNAAKRRRNLENASREGWHLHTEYHWSRTLNGKRLNYWPSRNKWQFNGKVMCGDVLAFIKKHGV